MFHKEKEVLRQIAKASDAIRRKHRMLKLGKEDAENMLSETFRPIVTPLEKLVKMSDIPVEHKIETKFEKHKEDNEEEEEKEEEEDNDEISFITATDEDNRERDTIMVDQTVESAENYEKLTKKYLFLLKHNRKQCLDMIYGVRKLSNGSLMIGDTPISFNDQYIEIGDKRYLISTGLLELLFKQRPDEAYVSADDLEHYKEILVTTNAHKKKYSSSEFIRADKGSKYKNIIIKLLFSRESSSKTQSTSGSLLKNGKIFYRRCTGLS